MHKATIYKNLDTNDISPKLVRTYVYNLDKSDWIFEKFDERYIENYEFEFIIESQGFMILEGVKYPLKPGDICFRKPGEKTQGIRPYSCYLVSFKMCEKKYNSPFEPYYQNEVIDKIPSVCSTKNYKYFERLFKRILDEYLNGNEASIIKIKSAILNIIYSLYEEVKENYLPSSPYYGVISKAIKYFENNYHSKILLDDVASYLDMSPFYFHKIFKQTMQITPNEYLTNLRINRAKELLIMTKESIIDIALKCGFESSSYFCYLFRKKMHITPKTYRKLHSL